MARRYSGLARIDLIISDQGNETLLEVNALPDMGPHSLVPKLAHAAGLKFEDLVEQMVGAARLHAGRRQRERRRLQVERTGPDRRMAGEAHQH